MGLVKDGSEAEHCVKEYVSILEQFHENLWNGSSYGLVIFKRLATKWAKPIVKDPRAGSLTQNLHIWFPAELPMP